MSDQVDRNLTVSPSGLCNHCLRYDRLLGTRVAQGTRGKVLLEARVSEIKRAGKGKQYDCLIGVSGGTDSTYVAYLTKQLGLRPLALHVDNGWNSELAVANVHNLLSQLEIDLETSVLNWPQFKDLQVAFLRASTPDGEVPTDHAIQARLWQTAREIGVKTIISGMNFATESTSVPEWSYGHSDWRYIRDVHRRFGTIPIPDYPHYNLAYLGYVTISGIRILSILNYMDYDKSAAQGLLKSELGWRDYGGKHHESVYTRFYQGVVLPEKFGIDKRFGHLSDLINAKQISRETALQLVQEPTYERSQQVEDREYVLKKLGLSEAEYGAILEERPRSFREFKNSYSAVQLLRSGVNRLRKSGLYDK